MKRRVALVYRSIVASQIRGAWRRLQNRDAAAVLDRFAASFEYRFVGSHALGGTRRTRDAQAAWFARLFRVFPDIEFTVRDVLVAGWPWRTRAVAIIDVRLLDEPGRDQGEPVWTNEVFQLLELRWGRIRSITTLTDTQREVELLRRRAERGLDEALAPEIADGPPAVAHTPA
jgi:ketosteroid isomerase-like protein